MADINDPTGIIALDQGEQQPAAQPSFDEIVDQLISEMKADPRNQIRSAARAYAPRATGDMPSGTSFVPPIRGRGEARTNTTSLGDLVPYSMAPAVSSTQRGLDAIANVGGEVNQMMRDTAYAFTGIPAAQRGGQNLAEAAAAGDLPRAAGALAQIGFAAAPMKMPTGRIIDDIIEQGGRYVGVPLAAGMPWNPTAQATDQPKDQKDPLTRLLEQQSALQRQAEAARQRREGFRPKGRAPRADLDPQYTQADEEFQNLSNSLKALEPQIAMETRKNDPAYQEQMRKEREANRIAEQNKRASTPTRELFSDYMPYLYPASTTLAMVLGGGMAARALGNRNQLLQDLSTRWQDALTRANSAAPNSVARRQAMLEAQGINQLFDDAVAAGASPFKKAAATGAKVGVTGAFLPEEIDFARAISGSPLWESLKQNIIDDPVTTGKRMAMGGGFGALSGMIGATPAAIAMDRHTPPNYGPETRALTATTPEPRIPSREAARRLTSQESTALRPAELPAQDAPRLPPPQSQSQSAEPPTRAKRSSGARGGSSQSLPEGHKMDARGNIHGPNGRFTDKPKQSQRQSTQMDDTKPYGRE